MINVENQIFNKVSLALKAKYSNIVINNDYYNEPKNLPSVYIIEEENENVSQNLTLSNRSEVANKLTYLVEVYTDGTGKINKAKEIFNIISLTLEELNFNRITSNGIPNQDTSIYRYIGRFTCVVDKNNVLY